MLEAVFSFASDDIKTLIGPDEPKAVSVRPGKSPLIFNGPHNGFYVPRKLRDHKGEPLGLGHEWFDPQSPYRRHEASDWGMMELFEILKRAAPDVTLISGNYSRLVTDNNRVAEHAITETSTETGDPVPGNLNVPEWQKTQRMEEIYDVHDAAVTYEINRTRHAHNGAIFIDLHSFTPDWRNERRPRAVGTIYPINNGLAEAVNGNLQEQMGDQFRPHYPYVLDSPETARTNLGQHISKKHGIWYVGIEIRNDILAHQEGLLRMTDMLTKLVDYLENYPQKHLLLNKPAVWEANHTPT